MTAKNQKPPILIYGPQGCGKTTLAEHFKLLFGLDSIIDEFFSCAQSVYSDGTLYLSIHEPVPHPKGVRVLSFAEAKRMLDEERAFGDDDVAKALRAMGEGPKPTSKDTNPKDAVGIAKAPASVVPRAVLAELGLAMFEGARKYGRHNYRIAGVRASVYFDALIRHIEAWWEGEDVDPDSGLSHITKAIATLVVLRDAMMNNKFTDDRPPAMVDPDWQRKLNELAKRLIEKYPDPKPAFTRDHQE